MIRYFDAKTSYFFCLLCVMLLFLPKVNFVTFGKETAGIRFDDFVLLSFSLFLMWAHFSLKKGFGTIEKAVLAIVGFSFLSFFLNRFFVSLEWIHVDSKIFYVVRILEYFMFFYIGLMALRFFKLSTIILSFLLMNLALMVLQKMGLVGEFSVEGYNPTSTYRPSGIASFASEMGLMLNIMFCYLLYNDELQKPRWLALFPRQVAWLLCRFYPYLLFLVFGLFIVMNGSRIAIAALVLSFLPKMKEEFSSPSFIRFLLMATFSVAATGLIVYGIFASGLAERSKGIFSTNNLSIISEVWEDIDINQISIGNENLTKGESDVSWWMRIHKWCYATKIFYLHPHCYFQGVGPGFATAGLDGGVLRIFVEYGIIGFFLYARLFYLLSQQSKMMKWCVIVALVNMLFFDVYLAYKPMSFLFLMAGYSFQNTKILPRGVVAS